MDTQSLLDLVARLRAEADRIETMLEGQGKIGERQVDGYYTSICPPGFDTVLGFLAKTNPEALANMDQMPEATLRDGWWLTRKSKAHGIEPVKVPACEFLRAEYGIEKVNAYPLFLLEDRLG